MTDTSSSIIAAHIKKRDAEHRKKERPSRPKKLPRTVFTGPSVAADERKGPRTMLATDGTEMWQAIDCRYANEVPSAPVPKLLPAMPNSEKFFSYKFTGLEDAHRPILLSEEDIVTDVEIMDPNAYGPMNGGTQLDVSSIDDKDASLLADDDLGDDVREMQEKKLRMFDPAMAKREAIILRRHILLSNDIYTERSVFVTGNEAAEKKLYRDPAKPLEVAQIAERVEQTFAAAKKKPVHPHHPRMKAKRVLPVVPDFDLWGLRYQQVAFDEPPDVMEVEDLLHKTVPNARTTCFSYFSKKTDGAEGEYGMIRNYVWDNRGQYMKAQAIGSEQLLLSFPDEGGREEVWFALMPGKMQLSKQKAKRLDIDPNVHHLNVSYREPSAKELEDEEKITEMVREPGYMPERPQTTVDYVDGPDGGEWSIKGPGGVEIDINSAGADAILPLMENGKPQDSAQDSSKAASEKAGSEQNREEEEELFGREDDD